ncbi:MAG: YicC/YloC family endoribonuclease [Eubacteriales bacterium]|nr:YicC family protein [Lachnospiraceae bacterium]MDO4808970.1 YicC/YloC family endoribonuclease [Eubacteriales bacterium]
MNPICSMTGFGRAEKVTEEYRLQVEIKSVNHRYLDLSVKMPRKFNCLEAQLRQILKEYMERGKTDIYVSYEDYSEGSKKLLFNKEIAGEYLKYLQQMAEEFGLKNEISASVLGRFPEVFSMEESSDDEGKLLAMLEPVAREAFADFRRAREEEGERLREDLLGKLSAMEDYVRIIEGLSPSVVDTYRQKLYSKLTETLKETGLSADEARIVTEVTIYSDKVCTDEEMVRLKSHIASMKQKLQKGGPCGRELDFIAQEMNREANTTLSKANSLSVADTAIALKTEIEKVREQVQNIE